MDSTSENSHNLSHQTNRLANGVCIGPLTNRFALVPIRDDFEWISRCENRTIKYIFGEFLGKKKYYDMKVNEVVRALLSASWTK